MLNTIKSCIVIVLFLSLNILAQDYRWEWQSPKPQGNYLYEFQFANPMLGFIRTSGRNLLSTTDAGKTWNEKIINNTTDYFGQVSSLFFPDSLHGFVAGYDAPPYISKTKDGGKSWQKVSLPSQLNYGDQDNIRGLFFLDSLRGFIGDEVGYIFRTTDGGDSWVKVKSMNLKAILGMCFPDSMNGYALSTFYLYVSRDGGKSWVADTVPKEITDYKCLFFKDSNHGWISAEGKVYRTTDGGMKWSVNKVDSVVVGQDLVIKQINFIDNQTGWLATSYGLYKTSDGGVSWKNIYYKKSGTFYDFHFTGVYFIDSLHGFATGDLQNSPSSAKFLYKTTDGGLSWTTESTQVAENSLFGVDFVDRNSGWAVGTDGVIVHTSDGGKNWEHQMSNTTSQLEAVSFLNQNNGWAVGNSGVVLHTTDGGQVWTRKPVKDPRTSTNAINRFMTLFFINENEGWIAGRESPEYETGRIFHTTDSGVTWEDQTPKNIGIIQGVSFISRNTGWICRGGDSYSNPGEVYRTDDGGKSWRLQFTDPLSFFDITFVDSLNGWLVGDYKVFKTTDGGQSWSEKSTNRSFIRTIRFLDKLNGYMAGSSGDIWYTTDGGDNWTLYNSKTVDGIYGIDFVDINTGWVVTNTGSILHTENFTLSAEKYDPFIPADFKLFQNYPNPFNPTTNIRFRLNQAGHVKVEVYDIVGRKIRTLLNEEKKTGEYTLQFSGEGLSSGIYIYQVIYQSKIYAGKMVIMK